LAIVICFTHDEDILKEWDKSERVYDQWKSSNHILRIIDSTRERIVEHVQGRGAQVSINHSKTLEGKPQKQKGWELLKVAKIVISKQTKISVKPPKSIDLTKQ